MTYEQSRAMLQMLQDMTDSGLDSDFDSDLPIVIIEWIREYMDPDDVFGETELGIWAEGNGYVRDDQD